MRTSRTRRTGHHFLNPLHLRELTFFSFYLNHLLAGDNPAGYHIVNVLLHIANAALLFFLAAAEFVETMDGRLLAAAIFLVHPIQTEPVLYVYQRSTLLACFFSLLGFDRACRRIGSGWRYCFSFALSKERNRPWRCLLL